MVDWFTNTRKLIRIAISMKQKNIIVLTIIFVGVVMFIGGYCLSRSMTEYKAKTEPTLEQRVDAPAVSNICKKITTMDMKNVFDAEFNAPNITKSSVTGGLGSDTCSFQPVAKDVEPVQVVVKYQTANNSTPSIDQTWKDLVKQTKDSKKLNRLGDDSFYDKTNNTLYVLDDLSIVSINQNKAEQGKLVDLAKLILKK